MEHPSPYTGGPGQQQSQRFIPQDGGPNQSAPGSARNPARPGLRLPFGTDGAGGGSGHQQLILRPLSHAGQELSPPFDIGGGSGVRARPMTPSYRGSPPQFQALPNIQAARRYPAGAGGVNTPQQFAQLTSQLGQQPHGMVTQGTNPAVQGYAQQQESKILVPAVSQSGGVVGGHFRPVQHLPQAFAQQSHTAPAAQKLPPHMFTSNPTSYSNMSDNINNPLAGVPNLNPAAAAAHISTKAPWLSPTVAQQCALTASAMRVEGAFEEREFSYTEGYLRGLADCDKVPNMEEKLTGILTGVTGTKPQVGSWVSECWRALVDPETAAAASGRLSRSQSGFNGEIWIKKYSEPVALRHFHCVRMYSPEHLVVPPHFPLNARRVKEAAVSPQFIKMLPALGFRCSNTNTSYVSALLFHMNPGSSDAHLLILVQKCFKHCNGDFVAHIFSHQEATLTEELFPGKILVEIIGSRILMNVDMFSM